MHFQAKAGDADQQVELEYDQEGVELCEWEDGEASGGGSESQQDCVFAQQKEPFTTSSKF